ncbi:polysaccharide lyase family 8 super-sandwich domain-containing protein [Streptomyces sp. C10-9-1]|uniref:polysaccharide lyase family 8 super-sandwich domain-containing protein n=1 Tax=Streptomyces sp. C10-9-1 TaxID=1859285 RepID=UPI003F4A8135
MHLSRRTLLSALPAAALTPAAAAAAAAGTGAPPPPGTAVGSPRDRATLIANALAVFAGTEWSNTRPETARRLAAIESSARARLADMDRAAAGELFRGLPLGESDGNLTRTFRSLYEIALATRVPGAAPAAPAAPLRGDREARRRVTEALVRLHEEYVGDQAAGYYGNWHTWEIGFPRYAGRILALLHEELSAGYPGLAAAYTATMDAYLRNGRDGDVDLDSRFHTGANLADITTNRVLQGAVLDDDARIRKALADQATVLTRIDPYRLRHGVTDGFYADGSFLQHSCVAYTGSYGKGLLTRMVESVRLLDGTAYAGPSPGTAAEGPAATALRWIAEGFAPLVFEGWLMECVKGRAVSRTAGGYTDTAAVVEAAVDLTAHLPRRAARRLAAWVKHVHTTSAAPPDPAGFASPVTIARHAGLLASSAAPADLLPPAHHAAFNAMDRTVHRRPGYAFALARSSDRVGRYEYMNGENLTPWFQGDGAHQLYLAGADQARAHGADRLTVLEPHRLPGTTAPVERRRSVPELYGTLWYDDPEHGFTASSEAQNAYVYFPRGTGAHSGGARLGAYGTAAHVLTDDAACAAARAGTLPDGLVTHRSARGTRSWYLLDEEIVVLAAGVCDPEGRALTTTLDARIAEPDAAVAVTGELPGGAPWNGSGAPAWLRYEDPSQGGAIGYLLLSGPAPTVLRETVTRSRRRIRLSNPDTPVTRQVFTLAVDRPPGAPPMAHAYALVPHATPERLRAYASGPPEVLCNTPRLQAVHHSGLGLTAVNSFGAGRHRVAGLTVRGPASLLLRRTADGRVHLALADPTTRRRTVSLTLRGRPLRLLSADRGVSARPVPGGVRLEVSVHRSHGRSLRAVLGPLR